MSGSEVVSDKMVDTKASTSAHTPHSTASNKRNPYYHKEKKMGASKNSNRKHKSGPRRNAALSSLNAIGHHDQVVISSESDEIEEESKIEQVTTKQKQVKENKTSEKLTRLSIPTLQFDNSNNLTPQININTVKPDVLAMQSLFISRVTSSGSGLLKDEQILKESISDKIPITQPTSKNVPSKESTSYSSTCAPSSQMNNVSFNENIAKTNELFMLKIAPLYAVTSTRSLENLRHHPQFQQLFQNNSQTVVSTGDAPQSPQYLQNLLQHPLLCQTFTQQISPSPRKESNKNHRKKNKFDKITEQSFEKYWTIEDIDEGVAQKTVFIGALRINPKQYQHAYISFDDRSEQDIFIDGIKDRNRALDGDIVAVFVFPEEENQENDLEQIQKKGKVVFIKEKIHSRTCIGSLKLMADRDRQKALFIPRDNRMPRLHIPFTSWPDNFYKESHKYENTLFLAKIIDWWDPKFALATIVCNIGQSGDLRAETKAILAENDLDVTPFGPEVRKFFPKLDSVIPEEEISKREDCRKMCIFSIDPFNCRDIDDAVSCEILPNGNIEVGVHISDVAHYLQENTILDAQVADKATTIYLVDKAYHMLPDELCTLCSLFPGIDKLAFSVFWEITPEAQILKSRIAKTVINSCAQLAYEHAQDIIENKEDAYKDFPEIHGGWKYENIKNIIKQLAKLSGILRKRRFDGGALRIDQTKISFTLDPVHGVPLSFQVYHSKESHQLIEEFMLLANMTVAQKLYDEYPDLAFLRCHPPPSMYMLRELAKSLKPLGIDLDVKSAGDIQLSLKKELSAECGEGKAMVLNLLCAKAMTRALYFCAHDWEDDNFRHYALNVPLYTHFTSPIRRYADIMVHRLLAASVNNSKILDWQVDTVKKIASNCNKQKYNAKKAGEMSSELYTFKYIEMNSPVLTEAVVVDVREKYIDVIVICLALNRRIYFNNDFPAEYKCIKNSASNKLSKIEIVWPKTPELEEHLQIIEVFSIIKIQLEKSKEFTKVDSQLVRPIS